MHNAVYGTRSHYEHARVPENLRHAVVDGFRRAGPGTSQHTGNREDVQTAKDYVTDVFTTVSRILSEDHRALTARAAGKYGDNNWAIAIVLINNKVDQCAKEINYRRVEKLEGVDIWAPSHCRTALVYAEWDVGPR